MNVVIGLREAYESAAIRLGAMTFDQFAAAVADMTVHPIFADGKVCGAVLVRGSEIHACVLPWAAGKWFGRRAARVLNAVIDKHGEATTQATTQAGRRFVEALGFIKDGEIYRSTKKWALKQSLAR